MLFWRKFLEFSYFQYHDFNLFCQSNLFRVFYLFFTSFEGSRWFIFDVTLSDLVFICRQSCKLKKTIVSFKHLSPYTFKLVMPLVIFTLSWPTLPKTTQKTKIMTQNTKLWKTYSFPTFPTGFFMKKLLFNFCSYHQYLKKIINIFWLKLRHICLRWQSNNCTSIKWKFFLKRWILCRVMLNERKT